MMAFMAHGHVPGKGQYGTRLERATDYVLSCQKQNGLVTKLGPDGPKSAGKSATKSAVARLTTMQSHRSCSAKFTG